MLIRLIGRSIGRKIVKNWEDGNKQIEGLVSGLSESQRVKFDDLVKERKKNVSTAYLCWIFYGSHYLYTGKPVKQLMFWLTFGGLFAWWFLDLFLMAFVVDSANRKIKMQIIEELLESGFKQQTNILGPVINPKNSQADFISGKPEGMRPQA